MTDTMNRRRFLQSAAAGVLAAGLSGAVEPVEVRNGMPYRTLGKTGVKVSLLCLGGSHIGMKNLTDDESVGLMRHAVDEGVNFFDNAWAYHNGVSEERMGKALKDGYRDRVFLMTKNKGRDAASARQHLEDSLRRLDVDVIDLLQVHEVVRPGDVTSVYDKGVLDVLLKAREQGKIRHIGVTGHHYPKFLNDMIDGGFPWETIQMPLNIFDAHFRSFQQEVLPRAVEMNLGVIAMKTMGGSPATLPRTGAVTPEECLRWAMSLPVSTVCSGMDTRELLDKNLRTVKNFTPLTDTEKQDILARALEPASSGEHEHYKTLWHRDVQQQMDEAARG